MSRISCTPCRLRFTSAAASYLLACPECGERLQPAADAAGTLGYRLWSFEDDPQPMPQAVVAVMPVPGLGDRTL
jgi:hypothetical protein